MRKQLGLVKLVEKHLKMGFWGPFMPDLEAALKAGDSPNAVLADGRPVLHALIGAGHAASVDLLLKHGANIRPIGSDGHTAMSLALATFQLPLAKQLMWKWGKVTPEKALDPVVQAGIVALTKKDFNNASFININAQNKAGKTLLHIASQNGDTVLTKKLLSAGINPLIKDNDGKTALKVARDTNQFEVIKTIVNDTLENKSDILKNSDFTLLKAKDAGEDEGISIGGFYRDKNNQGWLLKEGQKENKIDVPEFVANEYISGALYQLLLGDNAPQTEIVVDDYNGILLIGSKLLANFNTFSEPRYEKDFPQTFNGKPLSGFMDGIVAINFLAETDANYKNVGVIDRGDHYSFAKIDHGYSFEFSALHQDLDSLRKHLKGYYKLELEALGFDQVYQSINKVSQLDFSEIENVVTTKIETVKSSMQALELSDLYLSYDKNHLADLQKVLDDYQSDLLAKLKVQHQDYQKMANFMSLEKAILDHDAINLSDLIDQGVSLGETFKPFCNQGQPTSGTALVTQYWPDLLTDNSYPAPLLEVI